MSRVAVMQALLWDWEQFGESELTAALRELTPKLRRWLATHHPDNRTRRRCLEESGVAVGPGAVVNVGIVISDGYLPLVTIGARAALSPNVLLIAQSGPNNSRLDALPDVATRLVREAPVTIGEDAWVGAGAIILPGVHVGAGSVIGAGAVVARDVAAGAVVRGEPARARRSVSLAAPDAA